MNHSTLHARIRSTRRQCGAVMSETVLVLPLVFLFLGLTYYFGLGFTRAQRTTVMTQYEVWRQVGQGSGPTSQWQIGHPQLNQTFHDGNATSINHRGTGSVFPEDVLEQFVSQPDTRDAQDLAASIIYRPPGGVSDNQHRYSHGHREGFSVNHPPPATLFQGLHGPIRRTHVRIGNEWKFSLTPTASAGDWSGSGNHTAHLRGIRDAFLSDFDGRLDSIDGRNDPEYDDYSQGPEHVGSNFAAEVRRVYLRSPGYSGPTVR